MTVKECYDEILEMCTAFDQDCNDVNAFIEMAYNERNLALKEAYYNELVTEGADSDSTKNKIENINKVFIEKSIAARKYTSQNLSNFASGATLKISKLIQSNDYKRNIGKIKELIQKNPEVGSRLVSVPDYSESKKLIDEAVTKLETYIKKVKSANLIREDELKLITSDCKRASSGAKQHRKNKDIAINELVKYFETSMSLDNMTNYAKKKEPIYRDIIKDLGPEAVKQMEAVVNKGLTKLVNLYGKMIQIRAYLEWYEAAGMYKALKSAKTFKEKKPKEKLPKAPRQKFSTGLRSV